MNYKDMKTTLTLQKQILSRIKTQGIRPVPKEYFKIREYVIWGLVSIFILALSIGFAMIVFMIKGTDIELFNKLGLTLSQKLLYTVPLFWIITTTIIAVVAFVHYRNTRTGYKTSTKKFIYTSTLIAVIVGSVAYVLDISKFVDTLVAEHVPLYTTMVPVNTNTWLDPEHGLLSGFVRSRESENDFMLRDSESVLWHVTGTNIVMPKGFTFSTGERIKLIGKAGPNDTFRATEIIPWER